MSEATLMRRIMLAVAKTTVLFRNQSGAYKAGEQWIRYGLGNPGGSDLIGWTSVEVTPEMVGKRLCVFTAIEVKTATGRSTKEQEAFIAAVQRAGGLAGVVRSEDDAQNVVKNMLR